MDAFSTELAKVLSWYCDSIETVKSSEFSNRKIAIDGSNYFIQQKESKSWCLLKALSNAILMQSREVEACYVFEKESDKGTEQKEDDDEDRMQKCDKIKELLSLFGFPVIQSLSSTPAECAALVHGGQVYASAGQWLECLAHGSKYNVLDLDFLGGKIEVVQLDVILEELRITYMQFIDLCIIVGNKYGEGIIGIGPRRAYEWIVEFQNIETIIKQMDKEQITIPSNWPYQAIRDKFLHPVVNKNLKLMWKKPDVAGIVQFLSNEHNTKKDQTVSELKRMLDEPSITSKMKSLMSRVLRALSSSNSNPDKQFSTEILEEPSPVERSYSCSFNCRRDNLSGFFLRIKCRDKCNFILHKECFESSMKEQGYLKKKFYKGAKCPTDGCTALFNDIQELGKTTTKSYFMDKCKTEKKPPVDNKTKKRQDKYLKKWKKIDQEIDQGNNPVKTDSAETAFMENTKYETHELGSSTRLAPSTLHEEVIKLVKPTTNIELKYKVSCKNQEQLRKRNLKKNLPVHISDLQRRATTVEQTGSLMLGTKEDKEKYGWACDAYAVTPFAAFLKELDETEDRDGRRDRRGGFGDRGGGGGYGDRGGGFGDRGGYGGGGGGNGDRRRSSPRRRF